jgi:hypothetical protein
MLNANRFFRTTLRSRNCIRDGACPLVKGLGDIVAKLLHVHVASGQENNVAPASTPYLWHTGVLYTIYSVYSCVNFKNLYILMRF